MEDRTQDRLLYALKAAGSQTAATLAERLSITPVAVRQHLAKLEDERLVTHEDRRESVGRPKRYWTLTGRGHRQFPDSHSGLTLELLDSVRSVFGEDGLERLIRSRESRTLERYRKRLEPVRSLRKKVAELAALRSEEGYMAEWWREADGSFVLAENHCPICVAAHKCQGLCRSEREIFERVLGPDVAVERAEHLLAGGRRCTYRIASTSDA